MTGPFFALAAILPFLASPSGGGERISFLNDVIPALTRAGCNQGACHGAAAGKGGFRLSLRGYAPELDHETLTRELGGRRISPLRPEESLLLKKPLLKVAHRGGKALRTGSREFSILLTWLNQGAIGPVEIDPHVTSLRVTPSTLTLSPGFQAKIQVEATFSNGSKRDVTYWAHITSNDERIAVSLANGSIRKEAPGETAITVAYQDKVAISRVSSPYPNSVSPSQIASMPAAGFIDRLIYSKLADLRLEPNGPCTDAEFCRRVTLDLTGALPSIQQLTAFQAAPRSVRRTAYVDQLLNSPQFTDYWTYRLADLLRVNRAQLKEKGMWAFYSYLHAAVEENRSWKRIASEVLTATGNTFSDGPVNYLRTALSPEDLTENISQGFLGVRVGCARCHNHPLEKWTQNDYYGMASLFSRVGRKTAKDPRVHNEMTIYNLDSGEVNQPRLKRPIPPTPLGGRAVQAVHNADRRKAFADWLTREDNYYFPRSFANRIWAHFMGRGLVEDVDDLRETNPASNEPLFDALAADFAKHGHDIRRLIRQIVTSAAYQRSSTVRPNNRQDDRYYSRFLVKRMGAEELLDSLGAVTGIQEQFSGIPGGTRAIQLPDTQVKSAFLDGFGRPARQITCACERTHEPSMGQALLFINGEVINRLVGSDEGVVAKLLAAGNPDHEIVETVYLTALSRRATKSEIERAFRLLQSALSRPPNYGWYRSLEVPAWVGGTITARRRALEDLLWAVVNSREFLFNH